ncbi:VanZ family protein [Bacillus sp. FJAT-45350]|uniref:VanZ family protein n=1 Tax=Bacillus sp. FJAT-45350 TaxID=2011014 RepID=UPI00211BEE80|nr:VanZ family protein [Bacillus sp. FJAT-45350]
MLLIKDINNAQPIIKINQKLISSLFKLFFGLYIFVLLYVTLLAWNYGASLGPEGPGGRNYNLTPFRSIYRISVYSKDIMDPIRILLGNIVLFIPFGLLLPLAFKKFAKSFFIIIFMGMSVSIFIEICQFVFTYRVSNIDDVILNTVGTMIGVIVFKIVRIVKRRVIFMHS